MSQAFSYAFDCSTEIVSDKPFDKIPVADLIAAMRRRLDCIERNWEWNRDAFNLFDTAPAEQNPIKY